MTPIELLKPRYEVVADYPGNDSYKVGEIISNIGPNYAEMLSQYPHLFRRLEWWEKRSAEDMPEYVKEESTGIVDKVTRFVIDDGFTRYYNGTLDEKGKWKGFETPFNLRAVIPATLEEYNDYIKSKQ